MDIVSTGLALGAEIRDLDIGQDLPAPQATALRDAWHEHLVLFVRCQPISIERHMAFTRYFGALEHSGPNYFRKYYGGAKEDRAGADMPPEISVISNIVVDGKPMGSLGSGEAKWHTDSSIGEYPPAGGFLRALEIPEVGGSTYFMNMYDVYDTLPADLSRRIAGLRILHPATHRSTQQPQPGFENVTNLSQVPGARHPIVRTHPDTGRPSLYLGRRLNASVVGLPAQESEALLDALWAHAVQDRFVYRHDWQVGDLVMWDNRCTMHRRDAFDPSSRRLMHKTQTVGSKPI